MERGQMNVSVRYVHNICTRERERPGPYHDPSSGIRYRGTPTMIGLLLSLIRTTRVLDDPSCAFCAMQYIGAHVKHLAGSHRARANAIDLEHHRTLDNVDKLVAFWVTAIRDMHADPARYWTIGELAKTAALSRSAFFEKRHARTRALRECSAA